MKVGKRLTIVYTMTASDRAVIRQSQDSHRAVIGLSSDSHQTVIKQSSERHRSSDSHQLVIRWSLGQPSDSHRAVIRHCFKMFLKSDLLLFSPPHKPKIFSVLLSCLASFYLQKKFQSFYVFYKVGILEPNGRKYPIVHTNGLVQLCFVVLFYLPPFRHNEVKIFLELHSKLCFHQ